MKCHFLAGSLTQKRVFTDNFRTQKSVFLLKQPRKLEFFHFKMKTLGYRMLKMENKILKFNFQIFKLKMRSSYKLSDKTPIFYQKCHLKYFKHLYSLYILGIL